MDMSSVHQVWPKPSCEGEDNIREWTGLEFTRSQRAVENIEKWRKLVMKSSPHICGAPTTHAVKGKVKVKV